MNRRAITLEATAPRSKTFLGGGIAFVIAALATAAPAGANDKFTLSNAVPDDVFIFTNSRHNPERQFLDDYWAEVWTSFQKSGVVDDLLELALSHLDDHDRAEATRVKERFTRLVDAVDWKALGAGEVAFGERMPKMTRLGDHLIGGPPDIVVLFRVESATVEQNFKGLGDLLAAGVDELKSASGSELALARETRAGTQLVSLDLTQAVKEAPRMPITIGRHADVLFLSMGEEIRDDVINLLAGKGDKKSMADSPRFRAAFAGMRDAEDAITFFDMQRMIESLRNMTDDIFDTIAAQTQDRTENARQNPKAEELSGEGIAKYQAGDYRAALGLFEKAHEVAADDSVVMYNLACMHAMLGENEKALDWLEKSVAGGFYSPGKIESDSDLEKLRDEPRFKAALANAQQHAGGEAAQWAPLARYVANHAFSSMGLMDYAATVAYTDGYAMHVDSRTVLAANAHDNPLYAVVASAKPVADYAKYLPRETTSYSVDGGVSLEAIYKFLEDTVRGAGEQGRAALAAWEGIQQQFGFDVHKDLLDWLDTAGVNVSFQLDGRDASVTMIKVINEDLAREKLSWGLNFGLDKLKQLSAQQPMLAMLAASAEDSDNPRLEGFHVITIAMMPTKPIVCGVKDGWLMMGTGEDDIIACLDTAAGKLPNVRKNERLMAESLDPDGPVWVTSFTDHRNTAKQIAAALGGMSMAGGMIAAAIPDKEGQQIVMKLFGIVAKLAPVVGKIDFFKSTSSYTTFDGKAWHSRSVTNYVAPTDRGHTALRE